MTGNDKISTKDFPMFGGGLPHTGSDRIFAIDGAGDKKYIFSFKEDAGTGSLSLPFDEFLKRVNSALYEFTDYPEYLNGMKKVTDDAISEIEELQKADIYPLEGINELVESDNVKKVLDKMGFPLDEASAYVPGYYSKAV